MILNFTQKIIAAALLVCALAAPVAAQSVKNVYFRNDCSLPIKFAARYTTPFNRLVVSDLKTIQPGETIEAVVTNLDSYEYVAFDRHRDWFGDAYYKAYYPPQNIFVPLPFNKRKISAPVSTQVITCKDSYGDDKKIRPRVFLNCDMDDPVYIAMRYKALDGNWKTFAYRKVVRAGPVNLPKTWNTVIYLFSRSEYDEKGRFRYMIGKDAEFEIKGRSYGFRKFKISDDDMIVLTC